MGLLKFILKNKRWLLILLPIIIGAIFLFVTPFGENFIGMINNTLVTSEQKKIALSAFIPIGAILVGLWQGYKITTHYLKIKKLLKTGIQEKILIDNIIDSHYVVFNKKGRCLSCTYNGKQLLSEPIFKKLKDLKEIKEVVVLINNNTNEYIIVWEQYYDINYLTMFG